MAMNEPMEKSCVPTWAGPALFVVALTAVISFFWWLI